MALPCPWTCHHPSSLQLCLKGRFQGQVQISLAVVRFSWSGILTWCGGGSKSVFHESSHFFFWFFRSMSKVHLVAPCCPRSLGFVLLAVGFQLGLVPLFISLPTVGFSWQIPPVFLLPFFFWHTACHLHCAHSYGTLQV